MKGLIVAAALVGSLIVGAAGAAERQPEIAVPRVEGPFTIDGSLDEAGWADANRVTLDFEVRPGENIAPPVQTEVLIGEDGGGLILGFIAHDPRPEEIRAYLNDRDASYSDDWVGVVLDTFNDERRAFEFFSNALGAQMDLINDDVNGNEDDSWDAIWDSAGQLTETGYVVEMYIPYRTLRFPATGEELVWGIDLIRRYPRDSTYQITSNPRDRDVSCYLCQLRKARGMAGAEPGRNLEITPVLVASRNESTPDPLTQPLTSAGTDFEPGLDVRWGITPDVSLSATINPDFSQVEADSAQLDVNTTFALFFQEKRPFFLEGQDTFDSRMNIVHTRNIADPDLGAKVIGKSGAHTYGSFVTDDTVTNIQIPGLEGSSLATLPGESTNFAGRYRHDVGERNSTIGAIATARAGEGYYNYVAGLDTDLQLTDNDTFSAQLLGSQTRYPTATAIAFGQPTDGFTGHAFSGGYQHNVRDWWFNASYRDVSEDFRADLGFVSQVGYDKPEIGGGYRWYPEEGADTWWTRMQWNANVDVTHDESGQLFEREFETYYWFQGPMQSHVEFGFLDRERRFSGTMFDERWLQAYAEFTPRAGLSAGIFVRRGDRIDFSNARLAEQTFIDPWIEWNIGQHLSIEWDYTLSRLDTQAGEEIFTANLNDVRFKYQFDIRSFLRLTVQHTDVERNPAVYVDPVDARTRDLGLQLLYSYKVNPQTVFFVGYSEAGFQDDNLPSIETFDRTAFVKLSYAWIP